jgi:hypothetical protein
VKEMSQATLDHPVTDKELDQFYGVELSEFDWAEARQRQVAAYDEDDLIETSWQFKAEILSALEANDLRKVGEIYAVQRATTIAKRVSIELTVRAA